MIINGLNVTRARIDRRIMHQWFDSAPGHQFCAREIGDHWTTGKSDALCLDSSLNAHYALA